MVRDSPPYKSSIRRENECVVQALSIRVYKSEIEARTSAGRINNRDDPPGETAAGKLFDKLRERFQQFELLERTNVLLWPGPNPIANRLRIIAQLAKSVSRRWSID